MVGERTEGGRRSEMRGGREERRDGVREVGGIVRSEKRNVLRQRRAISVSFHGCSHFL